MEFEWDEAKNRTNIYKHGVSFETARRIFEGPVLSWLDVRYNYGEDRHISMGSVGAGALLVVAYTIRNGSIRLISARPATRKEWQVYHEKTR